MLNQASPTELSQAQRREIFAAIDFTSVLQGGAGTAKVPMLHLEVNADDVVCDLIDHNGEWRGPVCASITDSGAHPTHFCGCLPQAHRCYNRTVPANGL